MKLTFDLNKSMDRTGLVQVQRTVQGKNGSFLRNYWVKTSEVKDTDKVIGKQTSKETKKPVKKQTEVAYQVFGAGDKLTTKRKVVDTDKLDAFIEKISDGDKFHSILATRDITPKASDSDTTDTTDTKPDKPKKKPRKVNFIDDVVNGVRAINRRFAQEDNIHNGIDDANMVNRTYSSYIDKGYGGVMVHRGKFHLAKNGSGDAEMAKKFMSHFEDEFGVKPEFSIKKYDDNSFFIQVKLEDLNPAWKEKPKDTPTPPKDTKSDDSSEDLEEKLKTLTGLGMFDQRDAAKSELDFKNKSTPHTIETMGIDSIKELPDGKVEVTAQVSGYYEDRGEEEPFDEKVTFTVDKKKLSKNETKPKKLTQADVQKLNQTTIDKETMAQIESMRGVTTTHRGSVANHIGDDHVVIDFKDGTEVKLYVKGEPKKDAPKADISEVVKTALMAKWKQNSAKNKGLSDKAQSDMADKLHEQYGFSTDEIFEEFHKQIGEDTKDTSKPSQFSADEFSKLKTDRPKAIQYLKDSGVTWKENPHEGINWMRACMAASKAGSAPLKKSFTSNDAQALMKSVLNQCGNDRDKTLDLIKSQGITWQDTDNKNINWMRATLAVQKHFKSKQEG